MAEDLLRLAEFFTRFSKEFEATDSLDESLLLVTRDATRLVDGAEGAAVTLGQRGKFQTLAASSELALRVDAIQYQLRQRPCIDAAVQHRIFRSGDLRTDTRWPQFGTRAAKQT